MPVDVLGFPSAAFRRLTISTNHIILPFGLFVTGGMRPFPFSKGTSTSIADRGTCVVQSHEMGIFNWWLGFTPQHLTFKQERSSRLYLRQHLRAGGGTDTSFALPFKPGAEV